MNKILKEYKNTKQAIDILTAELAEMKPKLIEVLQVFDGKVDIEGASFSLRSMKTYEFTPAFYKLEKCYELYGLYVI